MRRSEGQSYVLREYGSWSVLIVAFLTGLAVSRGFTGKALPLFLALALLINSKQPFTRWIRRKGEPRSLIVLAGHLAAATAILLAVFGSDIPRLLPLLAFPAAYLLMNRFAGEHFVLTELLGFALISLAAVLAKFVVTGGIDVRLFAAVALYFTAGVFKIKVLLLKRPVDRVLTAFHVVLAAFVYKGFHIPFIVLLPLLDNVVVAAAVYKVKLQTTGWIEVAKSLLFLALMTLFY